MDARSASPASSEGSNEDEVIVPHDYRWPDGDGAPAITEMPKVDGTDFYMFRSYESGREGFVTILANYMPLQGPGAGRFGVPSFIG